MKSIKDFDVKAKRVLVRCDFNVPLDKEGNVSDDFRIQQALPTIKYLIKNKAKIILMSHLDPGNTSFVNPNFTLGKVAKKLSELLNSDVLKVNDCIDQSIKEKADNMESGEVMMLENLRFHMGEVNNTDEFAQKLSQLGEIYINDAFSVCHRAHASIVGIPKYLPHGMGFLLEKEIENLSKTLENPKRPMVTLIGGKKVETKINVISNMAKVADFVIVSGLIKKGIIEKKLTFENSEKIISPVDNLGAMDIGDKTIAMFKKKILSAKTVVWNGPFGKFENHAHKKGTLEIAKAIIKSKAFSVVGGGETIEFLNKEGIVDKFSHVSTGGGAMLQYLSGEKLPGIEALK